MRITINMHVQHKNEDDLPSSLNDAEILRNAPSTRTSHFNFSFHLPYSRAISYDPESCSVAFNGGIVVLICEVELWNKSKRKQQMHISPLNEIELLEY